MSEAARILLVDDDQGFLTLLSMRLSAEGFAVETAYSGRECLQKIEGFLPDLVISDLRMDVMDGMELYEKIHKLMPFVPVIMITAHGSIPEAVAATQQGVFSFLPKPIDRAQLLELIHKALEQKGRLPESLLHVRGCCPVVLRHDAALVLRGWIGGCCDGFCALVR